MIFKKISAKMLFILLSISIISMTVMSLVSYSNSKKIIEFQIQKNMETELKVQINNIQSETQRISVIASQIAKNVESTYKTTSLTQYEEMLGKMIFDSDMALGSGIWFEPYIYDKKEQYVGPYVLKDGDKAVTTYEYSNADYDYFSYDWYKSANSGSRESVFTELYYDETLKTTMTTCAVPMYDKNDIFIGVITVDIEITKIQNLINQLKIGKEGKAYLFTKEGIYITHEDEAKVMKENILDSENKSLATLGSELIGNENGTKRFEIDNEKYTGYYSSIGNLGWKIMVQIPNSEVNKPLADLLTKLIFISVATILLSVVAIVLLVRYIKNNIKLVNDFALSLSNGDFSIAELNMKSKDELGQMGQAMNKMLIENRAIIKTITSDAEKVNQISEELNDTSVNLITNFSTIENATKQINEDMMNSSAATEEVNASVEEVNASVNTLAAETSKSYDMVTTIKARAIDIEKKSKDSYELATQLAIVNETNLNQSLEDAKVVKSIGVMAEAISQIAEQVNLLSLNAAIEAARAGEQGRGFAVVANEIGSLANQTTSTVEDIKQTITKVQDAFDHLMKNATQLLLFIKETVTPDYMTFVAGANLYRQDANDIEVNVNKIATMTDNIEKIINEVGEAIQNIAEASQNTVVNSGTIITNMDVVAELIENLADKATKQNEISSSLNEMTKKFIF